MIDFKLLIIGFLGLISFYFLYKEFREILFLKRKLKEIIGKSRIEVIEDLVKIKKLFTIKHYLQRKFKESNQTIITTYSNTNPKIKLWILRRKCKSRH